MDCFSFNVTFIFNITQSTITLQITYNFPTAEKRREDKQRKVVVTDDLTDGEQEELEKATGNFFSLFICQISVFLPFLFDHVILTSPKINMYIIKYTVK